jgi:hypothetical protein
MPSWRPTQNRQCIFGKIAPRPPPVLLSALGFLKDKPFAPVVRKVTASSGVLPTQRAGALAILHPRHDARDVGKAVVALHHGGELRFQLQYQTAEGAMNVDKAP